VSSLWWKVDTIGLYIENNWCIVYFVCIFFSWLQTSRFLEHTIVDWRILFIYYWFPLSLDPLRSQVNTWSSGSVLDYRSLPPVFKSRRGHIWRLFCLSLRLITFGSRSAHLAYLVHKSGRKTSIIIIIIIKHNTLFKQSYIYISTLAELPTITISAESLRFSLRHYVRTLKTTINLPFSVIIPYGAILSLS